MFIKGEVHEVNYPRGLVDKDTILNLMSQVELFPEEEYGDYGEVLESTNYCNYGEIMGVVADADTVEAIPKADYEARLKADMVAMLTDIQLEIEEYKRDLTDKDITKDHEDFDHNNLIEVINGNIQEKINELKENK